MDNQGIKFIEDLTINNVKSLMLKGGGSLVLDENISSTLNLLVDLPASSLTGFKGVTLEVTFKDNVIRLYFLATKAKSATNNSIALRFSIKELGIQKAFEKAILKRAELIEYPLLVDTSALLAPTHEAIYKEAVIKKGVALLEESGIPEMLGIAQTNV